MVALIIFAWLLGQMPTGIEQVVSREQAFPGQHYTYTLAVYSTAAEEDETVIVRDTIDPRLTIVRADPRCAMAGHELTCAVQIRQGAPTLIKVDVRVSMLAPVGVIKNTAIADYADGRRASSLSAVLINPPLPFYIPLVSA